MMRFEQIKIKNYGPYRDEEIVFSDQQGVTIIWGNNGTGKTTLLNIIKYALFGKFFGGKYKKDPKTKTMNKDALKEGERSFSVTLRIMSDSDIYELRREQCIKDDVAEVSSDSDFKEIVTLKKNGSILSPEDTKRHLNRILPEDISRFFLFDGELLKEYEALLEEGDPEGEGEKIKSAIEKILGVPLLKTSALTIAGIENDYEKKVSKAAQLDQNNQELVKTYNKLSEKIINDQSDLQGKKDKLTALIEQKNYLLEQMKSNKKVIALIEKKNSYQSNLDTAKSEYNECVSGIPSKVSLVWRYMLKSRATDAASSIESMYRSLEDKNSAYNYLKNKANSDVCPTCGRPYEGHKEVHLEPLTSDEMNRLELLRSIRKSLFSFVNASDQSQLVETIEKRLLTTQHNISEYTSKIKECEEEIGMTFEETQDIENLQEESNRCSQQIAILKGSIEQLESTIDEDSREKERLYNQIKKNGSGELEKLSKRKDTCHNIHTVLRKCIDEYCLQLKQNVEKDASRIFMSIDNSGLYSGLRINDSYGLELIDLEGGVVPARSSGFEHMIAISLIGGIHKNAPIEGPTIIDSPFGRIDRDHKPNVAKVFPTLAYQVIFLSFYGEIDEQIVRSNLSGNLVGEFELNHERTYSTRITRI